MNILSEAIVTPRKMANDPQVENHCIEQSRYSASIERALVYIRSVQTWNAQMHGA